MQTMRLDPPLLAPVPTDLPQRIRQLSASVWGEKQALVLIGRDPGLLQALENAVRFAVSDSPVLVTGETGTGKELFARALFLSSPRTRKAFLRVNCAQYTSEQLVVSELFGHKKGSFTGAVADHRGIFEEADGGCVFLDEVGELPLAAQAILLRLLGEGELVPVGGVHPRVVDVRVLAASSRDLAAMVHEGTFRMDLYYRLRHFQVHVPPLRERGNDWELIAQYYLDRLARQFQTTKVLSNESIRQLRQHTWPGNVREVKSCVETGFHMSRGSAIAPQDLAEALEAGARDQELRRVAFMAPASGLCARMAAGHATFWDAVYAPFMQRDLNRSEVRGVVVEGLRLAGGSYKRMLELFGIAPDDYLKFMDFLRHHQLKPDRNPGWSWSSASSKGSAIAAGG